MYQIFAGNFFNLATTQMKLQATDLSLLPVTDENNNFCVNPE